MGARIVGPMVAVVVAGGGLLGAIALAGTPGTPGVDEGVTTCLQDPPETPDAGPTRDVTLVDPSTISSVRTDQNYDSQPNEADGFPEDRQALLRWSLVTSSAVAPPLEPLPVQIEVTVTSPTDDRYEIFALKRPFSAGAATWLVADNATPWAKEGALEPDVDYDPTPIASFVPADTGRVAIPFNEYGATIAHGWQLDAGQNFGIVIRNLDATDGVTFENGGASLTENRPQLTFLSAPDASYAEYRNGADAYDGQVDTTIARPPPQNFNGEGLLIGGGTNRTFGLVRFDLGALPATAIILEAHLKLTVLKPVSDQLELRPMLRTWEESATWTQADDATAWASGGAQGAGTDHDPTLLASFHATSPGELDLDLADAGVAVVQAWIRDGGAPGFLLANTGPSGIAVIADREATTSTDRPKLCLRYGARVNFTACGCESGSGAAQALAALAAVTILRRRKASSNAP